MGIFDEEKVYLEKLEKMWSFFEKKTLLFFINASLTKLEGVKCAGGGRPSCSKLKRKCQKTSFAVLAWFYVMLVLCFQAVIRNDVLVFQYFYQLNETKNPFLLEKFERDTVKNLLNCRVSRLLCSLLLAREDELKTKFLRELCSKMTSLYNHFNQNHLF